MIHIKLFEELFESDGAALACRTLVFYYSSKQVLRDVSSSYSKSPQKPMLLMKQFKDLGIDSHFDVASDFVRFEREDFLVAHTPEYVDAVHQNMSTQFLPEKI